MPYHVELRSSLQRVSLFNLEREPLWERVLRPWGAGLEFRLQDHVWDPRDSTLRVLEGPALDGPDLALGQGWNNALKSGRDVTRALLQAPGTVVASTRAGHELGIGLFAQAGLAATDWGPVRQAMLEGRDPGVTAALVMVMRDGGPWLLDAGLALGALPGRTTLVAAEPGVAARLGGIEVLLPETVGEVLRRSRGSG